VGFSLIDLRKIFYVFIFYVFNMSCYSDSSMNESLSDLNKVIFTAKDGLEVTADLYTISDSATWILLCHQAGWSRGEYKETATKLNKLGFNCMAIDQRSGGEINGIVNETHKKALSQKLSVNYIDAKQDIEAAIEYLSNKTTKSFVLLGSSYSATLVLLIGKDNDNIKAIISCSPGEYYEGFNIAKMISGIRKPVWVTSSKNEAKSVTMLFKGVDAKYYTQFIPVKNGEHGSRALWEEKLDHEEYWNALIPFLEKIK